MKNNEGKDQDRILKAIQFACEKHSAQKRKGAPWPYIVHIYDVAQILQENNVDIDTLIAGILHDTVEDTGTTLDEICSMFGYRVASFVDILSENKALPYAKRKAVQAERIKNAPKEAKMVKCADCLSNIKSIYFDEKRGEDIWNKFNSTKDNINKLTEEEYDIENNIYTTKYVNLNISRKTSDALTLIHDMDSNELLSYKRVNKESFSEHINDELISEEIKEIQFADESNKLMDFPLVNSVCRFFQYNNNLSGDRQLQNIVEVSCNNISCEPFKRFIDIEYDECGRKIKEISSSGNYTEYEYYEM